MASGRTEKPKDCFEELKITAGCGSCTLVGAPATSEFTAQRRGAIIRALMRLGQKEQTPPPRGQRCSGPSSFVYFSLISNEFLFGHRLEIVLDKGN